MWNRDWRVSVQPLSKRRLLLGSLQHVCVWMPAWLQWSHLWHKCMFVACFFFSVRHTRQEMYIIRLLPNTAQSPEYICAMYVSANRRDWSFCCTFYVSVFYVIMWHLCAYVLVRHKTHLVTFKQRSCSCLKGLSWSPRTWLAMPEVSFKNIQWFYSQMFKHNLDHHSIYNSQVSNNWWECDMGLIVECQDGT